MLSDFIGGFASGMKGYIDQAAEDKRRQEEEKRRMEALKELEKWKMGNMVESFDLDTKSGEMVYRSASGKEISRRPASDAELARAKGAQKKSALELRELDARARGAEAEVDPEQLSIRRQGLEANIGLSRQQAAESAQRIKRSQWEMNNPGILGGGRGGSGGPSDMRDVDTAKALQRISELRVLISTGREMKGRDGNMQLVPLTEEQKKAYQGEIDDLQQMLTYRAPVPFGRKTTRETPPIPQQGDIFNRKPMIRGL